MTLHSPVHWFSYVHLYNDGLVTLNMMNCRFLFRAKLFFSNPHMRVVKSLNSISLKNWLNAPPVPTPESLKSPLSCCVISSFPTIAVGSRNVDATNTPPGFSTREISATAALGLGQQCIAAPACTASRDELAKGNRPTSALTNTREGESSLCSEVIILRSLVSPKQYSLVCVIMVSEKSDATTVANFPLAANRLENSPEPHDTSKTTPPHAPTMYSMAYAVSSSSPGKPAHAKDWRQPFSYTRLMSSFWKSLVPLFWGGSLYAPCAFPASRHRSIIPDSVGKLRLHLVQVWQFTALNGVKHTGHARWTRGCFGDGAFASVVGNDMSSVDVAFVDTTRFGVATLRRGTRAVTGA